MKFPAPILACLSLVLSLTTLPCKGRDRDSGVIVFDDKALRGSFHEKMGELLKDGSQTTQETLLEQLSRSSCKLDLPAVGAKRLTPAELYRLRLDSTLMIGKLHKCSSNQCKKTHASIASGVVIHEDGVVLTNYHVVGNKIDRTLGMGAMTHDGKAFLVEEVLAADEKSDVAILKLSDAKGLSAAPVFRDEPVGKAATIISNPQGRFFTLTRGYVSRYHRSSNGAAMMNVTADYAKGSSGGPIFNDRGDIIGLVANTVSIPYQHVPLHVDEESEALELAGKGKKPHMISGKPLSIGTNHQMTIKNAVPSRAILDLIKD